MATPEILYHLHKHDLPDDINFASSVAVDTETMGLNLLRDRLCLIQLSSGDGTAHLVQFDRNYEAPNLKKLLADPAITKIFHFARFDVAQIEHHLNILCAPIYCTKIASKLIRTYTDRHGLRDLVQEILAISISKQQQSSDWGNEVLSEDQMKYAASDVLYLHALREKLNAMLLREGRMELANACFNFLPHRARLDLAGWPEVDIFAH